MFHITTSQQVRKYPPRYEATVKVHLRAIKKGIRYAQIPSPSTNNTTATSSSTPTIIEEYDSYDYQTTVLNPSTTTPATQSPTSSPTLLPTTTLNDNVLAYDMVEQLIKPSNSTNYIYADYKPIKRQIYTDQSEPAMIPSDIGMKYTMVLYDFDRNLIWDTAIPSKTKIQLVPSNNQLFLLM